MAVIDDRVVVMAETTSWQTILWAALYPRETTMASTPRVVISFILSCNPVPIISIHAAGKRMREGQSGG